MMKIIIRSHGAKLTKTQRTAVTRQLALVLVRFGERIDRVIVRLSNSDGIPGHKRCQIEVGVRARPVSAEHSDVSISQAVEHAASRAARSVSRVIENESWALKR